MFDGDVGDGWAPLQEFVEWDTGVDPDEWEPIPASEATSLGEWDWVDVPGQPQPVPAGMDEPVHWAQLQPLGGATLTALAAVPVSLLTPEGCSLALRQLTLLSRHVDALKAEVTAAIAGPKPQVRPDGRLDDYASHEVAVATWTSVYAADRQVWAARDLTTRLTRTAQALREGLVSLPQAMALSQATTGLPPDITRDIEGKVLKYAHRQDTTRFKASLRRWVAKLDPDFTTKARTARAQAEVTHTPFDDGTGQLYLRGPLELTTTIAAALDAYASATKTTLGGTTAQRKLAGLRDWAEAYLASPDCPTRHGRPPTVNITIDLPTLLGMRNNPAEIPGIGPVPADAARWAITDGAPIRRLITDPATGHLLDHGEKTYTASPGLSDYLIARNITSAAPHSTVPAHHCDIEHNQPHGQGGKTSPLNCTPIDRRWHRAKTHNDWTYTKQPDGVVTWTSPTGLTCQIAPYDYR